MDKYTDTELLDMLYKKVFIYSKDTTETVSFKTIVNFLIKYPSNNITIILENASINGKILTITIFENSQKVKQYVTYVFDNKDESIFFNSSNLNNYIESIIRQEVRRLKIDNL